MDSLATKLESVLEQHYAEVLAAKDARIAELEAILKQIVAMGGSALVPLVEASQRDHEVDHVRGGEAAQPQPNGNTPAQPRRKFIPGKGWIADEPEKTDLNADLVYVADNERAIGILKRWVEGNAAAPSEMHDFLVEIHQEDAAQTLLGKNNSHGKGPNSIGDTEADPSMIACQTMCREAVFYMRNGTPQQVKDRLVKLFGKF